LFTENTLVPKHLFFKSENSEDLENVMLSFSNPTNQRNNYFDEIQYKHYEFEFENHLLDILSQE
jgi:hypothetical protein